MNERLRLITSRQNASVKELRRAFHSGAPTDDGYSAVEGMHLIEEAIRSGLRLKTAFFSQGAEERAHKLLPQLASHVETLLLPDDVFASTVLTDSPQGVAALVKLKTFKLDDILHAENPLIIGVAGVQDPGNLGTILRSAEAFGAHGAVIGEGSVSPWNPKVIRGSSGSVFRLPVVRAKWVESFEELRSHGIRILGNVVAQRRAAAGYRPDRPDSSNRGRRRRWNQSRSARSVRRHIDDPSFEQSRIPERRHRRVDRAV